MMKYKYSHFNEEWHTNIWEEMKVAFYIQR